MKLLFLIICMLISTFIFGQKGDVFIGVDLGYTDANIINRPFIDRGPSKSPTNIYDEERSFIISISGEYFFAKRWSVRSKIQYYQTAQVYIEGLGTFINDTGGNPFLSFEEFNIDRYERNSLSIPIQLSYSIGKGKLRGQVALGPAYSFSLSDNFQQNVFSTANTSNLGYAFSFILSYPIISDTTFIYLDLSRINSGKFENESIVNRTISLGVKFKL